MKTNIILLVALLAGCNGGALPAETRAAEQQAAAPTPEPTPPSIVLIDESLTEGTLDERVRAVRNRETPEQVQQGEQVVVRLPSSASASWDLTGDLARLVHPKVDFEPGSKPAQQREDRPQRDGEPVRMVKDYDNGTAVLTWDSRGQLDMPISGTYPITLEYRVRPQGPGQVTTQGTFSFTIEILGRVDDLVIDRTASETTHTVAAGKRVFVRLPAPMTSLARWTVESDGGLGAPSQTSSMAGTTVMMWSAAAAGSHEVTLRYAPPEETTPAAQVPGERAVDDAPPETFAFTVTVTP